MKILHTSDWHLGHTLYNYDRTEEQEAMLSQLCDMVREHRPDVFLLCGDVYHTAQPSAAVQTLLTNALVSIHRAYPEMLIVMTAGNHDSGTKHEIFRVPWREMNVEAIGQLEKDHPERHVIEVPGKGWVIALPYTHERNIPDGLVQQLIDIARDQNFAGLPIVMTAHTTVRGCDFSGHDHASEYVVGGVDSLELSQMGEGYDYLALGHIHHGQFVHGGHHRVRYCGTPIPVTFDEQYVHSVSMVELDRHGDVPHVEEIGIKNPHPLVTLPITGYTSWSDALTLLRQFPDDNASYIRLNVEVEDFLPIEAQQEAMMATRNKACRFCHINVRRKPVAHVERKSFSVQEFQEECPVSLAKRYVEDIGLTFDEEMEKLFEQVVQLVTDDMHND